MSLPPDHLAYPHRRYGMDQDRYDWTGGRQRPPFRLPPGKSIACMIVVPIEFHMLNPSGKPFKHPGAMQTPYPDLRHYTTRDYGNRVGVFRILAALKDAGLTATFAINAQLLDRFAPLVDAIQSEGHAIAAHGWNTDIIHWGGLDPAEETRIVDDVRAAFAKVGLAPQTWLSPARSQSFATPDIIRKAGFDICLDWEMDCVPVSMRTQAGPITCIPLANELDDRKLLIDQRQTEAEWRDQILAARDTLCDSGPSVLAFTLTPYVIGQPYRMWALRETLLALSTDSRIWHAAPEAIAEAAR